MNFVPFRYLGQYFDIETNLCYNRFRYYDPENGRYFSKDPIGIAANELNFYSYVRDVNILIDLFGLDFYYQLMQGDKVVYHGITERDVDIRVGEHFSDGKSFDQVRYLEVDGRDASRNLEGSALYHEWKASNESLLNAKRPVTPGYYHSYNPDNIKSGRNLLTEVEIENAMKNAETKKVVDGKLKCH